MLRSDAWCDWNTVTHFYEKEIECSECGGSGYLIKKHSLQGCDDCESWDEKKNEPCEKCIEIECNVCGGSGICTVWI